jgi:hypothetical protein
MNLLVLICFLSGAPGWTQVTTEDLSFFLFQDQYGQPYPPQLPREGTACDPPVSGQPRIGDMTADYLEEYCDRYKITTGLHSHAGIDYRARSPEPVYSPVSGYVTSSCDYNLGPVAIRVDDPSVSHTGPDGQTILGYTFISLHLSECEVAVGGQVHAGQRIGLSGNAGNSPPEVVIPFHLHVEVQRGDDALPCGRGGPNGGCPYNPDHPTSRETIAAATYNPRSVVKSIVFIRDSLDGLSADRILDDGILKFNGLGFGANRGRISVAADMEHDQEFFRCTGLRFLEWEVPSANIRSWSDTDITAQVFPYLSQLCGGRRISPNNLRMPLLFRVERSDGAKTNELPFPFKDIYGLQREETYWYTEPVVRVWAGGIVEGYKKSMGVDGARTLKAENRYAPTSPVKNGEALKSVIVAAGEEVDANAACACGDPAHWSHAYICSAIDLGWIECPFDPERNATRGFVAALLAVARHMPVDQIADGNIFGDVAVTHTYARQITFCFEQGIIQGYGDGRFGPDEVIDRAQMAKALVNAFFPE